MNETNYEIRKKYCPSQKKNVIIKVFFGECGGEICTERGICDANGGCTNRYLHSMDSSSHSL
ncbi:MAG: hypothetical protein IIV79_01080 [Clostridia bacterium]|nr:hypothetical protein [Clostridia bacterium]